jgi:hypothetical protein
MRYGHRRTHRLVWLFLLPLILIGLTMALALRKPPPPVRRMTLSPHRSLRGIGRYAEQTQMPGEL